MTEPVATKVHLLPPWHRRQQVDWIHVNDHKARRSPEEEEKEQTSEMFCLQPAYASR